MFLEIETLNIMPVVYFVYFQKTDSIKSLEHFLTLLDVDYGSTTITKATVESCLW